MNSVVRFFCSILTPGLLAAGLLVTVAFGAESKSEFLPQSGAPLSITDGTVTVKGERVPATLGNIVGVLQQRDPNISIFLAGSSDIVIQNVEFRWGRTDRIDMHGVLLALAAASGDRFSIARTDDRTFVLSANLDRPPGGAKRVQIMSLAPYVEQRAALRMELENLESLVGRADAGLLPSHEARDVRSRISFLREKLKGFTNTEELVGQISAISMTALQQLRGGDAKVSQADLPTLQLHKGSSLLIITGSPEGVDVVQDVVAALIQGGGMPMAISTEPAAASGAPKSEAKPNSGN